jgi:hypothetical protein
MHELIVRFLIGGTLVSAFAFAGDVLRPKSFAGIFGAAPAIALSTLILTISMKGKNYASVEARSMVAGAVAFFLYASLVSRTMMHYRPASLPTTLSLMLVWFGAAFGLWAVWLR